MLAQEKWERDQINRLEDSRLEGRLEGRLEQKKEFARKLVQAGHPLAEVAEWTDLSIREIELLDPGAD